MSAFTRAMAARRADLIFSFEDLLFLDSQSFGVVLNSIDQSDLVLALKACSDDLKNFFFANMSQRMKSIIESEWESMGKSSLSDIKNAQKKITAIVLELIENGSASIRSTDEEYV